MKKLNLQLGSIKEMLTKEQMKKITGGNGYGGIYGSGPQRIMCGYNDDNFQLCTVSNTDLSACDSACHAMFGFGAGCFCEIVHCHGFQQHGGQNPCN